MLLLWRKLVSAFSATMKRKIDADDDKDEAETVIEAAAEAEAVVACHQRQH